MSTHIILTIISGSYTGKKYSIDQNMACRIGSAADANIALSQDAQLGLSRYHCILDIIDDKVFIKDLASTNGTSVNGKNINIIREGVALQDGDKIIMANTAFIINIPQSNTNHTLKIDFPPSNLCSDPQVANIIYPEIDNYILVRKLGFGVLGTTYLAKDTISNELVAIKVFAEKYSELPYVKTMLQSDLQNSQKLQHPNIVTAQKIGIKKNKFYYISPYCNNGNLAELVNNNGGRLKIDDAVDILLQIIDALEYAHNHSTITSTLPKIKGFVHRNLKPQNILFVQLAQQGQITKISDFSLGKIYNFAELIGYNSNNKISGITNFISKQQVTNRYHPTPAMDIWSIAAIFYYMLTGTSPRNSIHETNPLQAVLNVSPIPIQKYQPDLPLPLAQFIDHALHDEKRLNYTTCHEFKNNLITILEQI